MAAQSILASSMLAVVIWALEISAMFAASCSICAQSILALTIFAVVSLPDFLRIVGLLSGCQLFLRTL